MTAEEVVSRCARYVNEHQSTIRNRRMPGTIAGLALELDLERTSDLRTLMEFPRYGKAIRQAVMRLEDQRAQDLANPMTKNARGIEFDLCNNFGWQSNTKVTVEDNRARIVRLPKRKPVGAPVEGVRDESVLRKRLSDGK